jgi:hypothetical protein
LVGRVQTGLGQDLGDLVKPEAELAVVEDLL